MTDFREAQCIRAPDATVAYRELLSSVLRWGEEAGPRGMKTKELRPVVFRIDGTDRWVRQPSRKAMTALGVLEALQLVGGFSVPQALVAVAPQYARFINPATGELDGAYGPRVIDQVSFVLRLLQRDPDSRQAVVQIYGKEDHRESADVPCTLTLQFFLRDNPEARYPNGFEFDKYCPKHGRAGSGEDLCICNRWWVCGSCGERAWGAHCAVCGKEGPENLYDAGFDSLPNPYFEEAGGPPPEKALELDVTMRSNDVWLGVPYDVVQFSVLQAAVAAAVGAAVGVYTHKAGSMHLYKRDWEKADRVIADLGRADFVSPPLTKQSFQRTVDECGEVVSTWWSERLRAKLEESGVDSEVLRGWGQREVSPFFAWCLDRLREVTR